MEGTLARSRWEVLPSQGWGTPQQWVPPGQVQTGGVPQPGLDVGVPAPRYRTTDGVLDTPQFYLKSTGALAFHKVGEGICNMF